jgi:hypothetical protein
MNPRPIIVAAALAVLTPFTSAAAQRTETSLVSLQPADTVRFWAPAMRHAGTVAQMAELRRDTLVLRELPGRSRLPGGASIPLPALVRLEVQRGYYRSAGRSVVGILLGVAAGTLVGAVAGVGLECGTSCADEGSDLAGFAGLVVGGFVGGLAGGITGGVLGARRRPSWRPVALGVR